MTLAKLHASWAQASAGLSWALGVSVVSECQTANSDSHGSAHRPYMPGAPPAVSQQSCGQMSFWQLHAVQHTRHMVVQCLPHRPAHPSGRRAAPMLTMVSIARSCKNRHITRCGQMDGGYNILDVTVHGHQQWHIRPPHHLHFSGRRLNLHDKLGDSPFLEVSHSRDAASGVIKERQYERKVGIIMAYLGSLDNVLCHPSRVALGKSTRKHVSWKPSTCKHVAGVSLYRHKG